MMERQQVLADFGELALRSQNLDKILTEACRLVGEALETGCAKVLEILPAERQLLVWAGVGWDPDIVGNVRMPMEEHSAETFAIEAGRPVVSQDIGKEHSFDVPPFMKEAGVVALVNVPIFLPGGRAYGLLQVDDTEPRDYGGAVPPHGRGGARLSHLPLRPTGPDHRLAARSAGRLRLDGGGGGRAARRNHLHPRGLGERPGQVGDGDGPERGGRPERPLAHPQGWQTGVHRGLRTPPR
jgi:GAF domain-containing protein